MDFYTRAEDSEMSADDVAMEVERGALPPPQATASPTNTVRIEPESHCVFSTLLWFLLSDDGSVFDNCAGVSTK